MVRRMGIVAKTNGIALLQDTMSSHEVLHPGQLRPVSSTASPACALLQSWESDSVWHFSKQTCLLVFGKWPVRYGMVLKEALEVMLQRFRAQAQGVLAF